MLGGPLHPIPSKGLYYFLVASFFSSSFFFLNRFAHQPLGEVIILQFTDGEMEAQSVLATCSKSHS